MRSAQLFSLTAVFVLFGCARTETFPEVAVRPNNSGIEIGEIKALGPSWLLGKTWTLEGELNPPDIPTRTWIEVKRMRSLHNQEPRYFTAASGLVQVVSVERFSDYRGMDRLQKWRRLLRSSGPWGDVEQKMLKEARLGEIPQMNAARIFHGKLRKMSFSWGDAILFLTTYIQGNTGGPVNNDMLVLVVQGLTKDGRYAVNCHLEIHHPKLPDSAWDKRLTGKAVFSIDDDGDEAERWLDQQSDDSFSPTFGQYEEFLASLEISPGDLVAVNEQAEE